MLSKIKYVFLSHLPFNSKPFFFAHLNNYRVTLEMEAETRLHSNTVPHIVVTAHLSYRSKAINFIQISSSFLRSLHAGNRRTRNHSEVDVLYVTFWANVPKPLFCYNVINVTAILQKGMWKLQNFPESLYFLKMRSNIFKRYLHQTSPLVQLYTSARVVGNIPESHVVKDFSALLSHAQ